MGALTMNRMTIRRSVFAAVALGIFVSLFGCASTPVRHVTGYTPAIGEKAAKTAISMIGRPYKYRGDSPEGFDCSGLVRYSYLASGLDVPHGTGALKTASSPVGAKKLRKGDLLFFDEKGGKYSHVGIYIGGNRFVHAPSTGQKVRKDSLRDAYWKKSFIEARRFQ
jgi:cell wall-associated NlpC family hydrolase